MSDYYRILLHKLYGASRLMLDRYNAFLDYNDIDTVKRFNKARSNLDLVLVEVEVYLEKLQNGQ